MNAECIDCGDMLPLDTLEVGGDVRCNNCLDKFHGKKDSLERIADAVEKLVATPFWNKESLDEIARRQGITEPQKFEDLFGACPDEPQRGESNDATHKDLNPSPPIFAHDKCGKPLKECECYAGMLSPTSTATNCPIHINNPLDFKNGEMVCDVCVKKCPPEHCGCKHLPPHKFVYCPEHYESFLKMLMADRPEWKVTSTNEGFLTEAIALLKGLELANLDSIHLEKIAAFLKKVKG